MFVYQRIAQLVQAYQNCVQSNNEEWAGKHADTLAELAENYLPSGSGFDSGTQVDLDASKPDRLVLCTSYHHMDDNGYYCGWSDHEVIVTPSLAFGYNLRITGRDRDGFKEYAYQVFDDCLRETVD